MFLIIDGIDGSGKGTIVDCLRRALEERGEQVFDAREAMRRGGAVPAIEDTGSARYIITCEPTYAWVGLGLREALIRDSSYDQQTVAQAFAADREIHYRRLVIPARGAGLTVVSERGISGSLAYQVVAGVPEAEIMALPGNRLALANPPDYLAIASVSVPEALRRLEKRAGKQDGSYYERRPFLERLEARYSDPAFRCVFTERGTRVLELSTEGEPADTESRCRNLLLPLL